MILSDETFVVNKTNTCTFVYKTYQNVTLRVYNKWVLLQNNTTSWKKFIGS